MVLLRRRNSCNINHPAPTPRPLYRESERSHWHRARPSSPGDSRAVINQKWANGGLSLERQWLNKHFSTTLTSLAKLRNERETSTEDTHGKSRDSSGQMKNFTKFLAPFVRRLVLRPRRSIQALHLLGGILLAKSSASARSCLCHTHSLGVALPQSSVGPSYSFRSVSSSKRERVAELRTRRTVGEELERISMIS